MSRRRHRQQLKIYQQVHQVRRTHDEALASITDSQERARLTASYTRVLYGFIAIPDHQPHYLCELGLRDICRGSSS